VRPKRIGGGIELGRALNAHDSGIRTKVTQTAPADFAGCSSSDRRHNTRRSCSLPCHQRFVAGRASRAVRAACLDGSLSVPRFALSYAEIIGAWLGNFRTSGLFYCHAQRNHCHDTLGFRASTFGRGSFLLSLGRNQPSGLNAPFHPSG
jgi:hypothetical protein